MKAGRGRQSIIARRLAEARLEAGLSQRELGVRAGLDASVASPRINQYERGTHTPNFTIVERLGEVLGLPLPYFYATDDTLAEVIRAFHKASSSERRQFMTVARSTGHRKAWE